LDRTEEGEMGWINGAFCARETSIIDKIDGDKSIWERRPLELRLQMLNLGIIGLWRRIRLFLRTVSEQECINFFRHAGYAST
jgi:hypothetical protein